MKKTLLKNAGLATLAIAASAVSANAQMRATRVEVNGTPLNTQVAPMQMHHRTLVPMRAIFNRLGAQVNYDQQTRQITARRGNTDVMLRIGSRYATVNGRNVTLDQAPLVRDQRTLVPLRFVSEALGAQVGWNENQRLVTIRDNNAMATNPDRPNRPGSQVGGYNTISVPRGAVVKVQLEQQLSSATTRRGDTFAARVVSQTEGDSEFPNGTRLEGVVTEATPRTDSNPGVLDLDFRTVVLPDGTRRPLRASLISLDNDSIDTTTRGRIMAKNTDGGGSSTKSVIVGGAAGYLLGRLLKRNSIITSVLGAGGGYLYDRNKNKDRTREAVIPSGTQFGVRLDNSVTYNDVNGYNDRRRTYMGT